MTEKENKIAMRISYVSILVNIVLTLVKLIAGVIGHSSAMISDAIHSASDFFSTIVVIIGIKLASRESDNDHQYGHERLECVAELLLAILLGLTGASIGYAALNKIIFNIQEIVMPGITALWASIGSIIAKEVLFWYTRIGAQKINSGALMADAWHHRSDALSSIGAFIGITFARKGYPVMDSVASLIICVFVLKVAFDIFKDAIDKMVDKSCDEKTENSLRELILTQDGVLGIDLLMTRVFANKIYVDLEILADGNKTLNETHAIAEKIHDTIETCFPNVKHIMIHVNPQ